MIVDRATLWAVVLMVVVYRLVTGRWPAPDKPAEPLPQAAALLLELEDDERVTGR